MGDISEIDNSIGEDYTYLIVKSDSRYYAKTSIGEIGPSNTDCGALLNTLSALLVEGDVIAFKPGVTYSGSTQFLVTNKKNLILRCNGAKFTGFTWKFKGLTDSVAVGFSSVEEAIFSGSAAGVVYDNGFAPSLIACRFEQNDVGISFESSDSWTEIPYISRCHFNDCKISIRYKSPTGSGTGSYINGRLDTVTFNSSGIAVNYTFIEIQAGAEVAESDWQDMRFWFNAPSVVGVGIDNSGSATRCKLRKIFFENFGTATGTIGMRYNAGSTGFHYPDGKPVFAGAGNWTAKVQNASNIHEHGVISTWRQTDSVAVGLSGSYGVVTNTINVADYGGIPNIYVIIGGTVGAETISVEIKAVSQGGITFTTTKTYTATGTYPLNIADYFAFASNNFYYILDHFECKAKTTLGSTSATVSVGGFSGGTAVPAVFETPKTFEDYEDFKVISAPGNPLSGYVRVYPKVIDSNNDGWFIKKKIAGSIVEVQVG